VGKVQTHMTARICIFGSVFLTATCLVLGVAAGRDVSVAPIPSDAGAEGPARLFDAGANSAPDLLPVASSPPIDAGSANMQDAAAHAEMRAVDAAGSADASAPPAESAVAVRTDPPSVPVAPSAPGARRVSIDRAFPQQESLPVVTERLAPVPRKRLPLLGVVADVGAPDGLIASLAVRPLKWVRLSAGGGSNFVSAGWRAGVTLLPLVDGISASFEYGRYQVGNANTLASTFGADSSPVLERVGYEYMNMQLGFDYAYHDWVFFLHAGATRLRGQLHNLDSSIRDATERETGTTGTTNVVVRQDPNVKATAPSLKLGLAYYVW